MQTKSVQIRFFKLEKKLRICYANKISPNSLPIITLPACFPIRAPKLKEIRPLPEKPKKNPKIITQEKLLQLNPPSDVKHLG